MKEEDHENLDRIVKDMNEQIDYEEERGNLNLYFADEVVGVLLTANDAKALVEYYEKTKGYET